MSVQYEQAPQLTLAQHDAIQREYDARAKNPTTAFLLCYFLGVVGAHRIYLGQWGAAAVRLLLPLIALALAILGLLDVLPFATFSLAVITLLCALAWEALDLLRLDGEVNAANAALMDHLIATNAPAGVLVAAVPQRPAPIPPEAQGATQPAFTVEATTAASAIGASIATSAAPAPPPLAAPEPMPSAPEPEPTTLTFEPEAAPSPAPDYRILPQESPTPSSPSILPPTASAYVPPVAPEIISGGFAAGATGAEEPESPPLWPGADAPLWPGASEEPQATTQPQPEPLLTTTSDVAATNAPQAPVAAPPPTTPPRLKHVRVRRKIMLDDGTVVGEQVLEDDFPIEMDTQDAAKILEARFQQMSLEEIARQANLPPGTELQLNRE